MNDKEIKDTLNDLIKLLDRIDIMTIEENIDDLKERRIFHMETSLLELIQQQQQEFINLPKILLAGQKIEQRI